LNKKTLFQAKELVEEINETIRNFKVDLKDKSTKPLVDIIKARLAECKTADDAVLSCMMTSFCVNLCLYS
jgi:ribosome-interacting GTPase 1